MGTVIEDLYDHEGYGARRLPDGSLTGTWSAETANFDAYVAACGCGWRGGDPHPPTEEGYESAVDEWERARARPLLAQTVPADLARRIRQVERDVAKLMKECPAAGLKALHELATWADATTARAQEAQRGASIQAALDRVGRRPPGRGLVSSPSTLAVPPSGGLAEQSALNLHDEERAMAHVEKRGQGKWRARYRGPDGRERSKTFDRRTDADRWLASIEVSKARGEWVDPSLGKRIFASWAQEWSAGIVDLRPSTLDRDLRIVRVHLLPRFGSVPLSRITNPMVRSFVADMLGTGHHSPATVRKVGQVLTKVMRGAVEAGLIARSPCEGMRLPAEPRREMRFLTAEQVTTLAEVTGPDGSALIYTAAYAGLRWGELAGLRIERVNVLRRTITVVEQLNELAGKFAWGPPKTAAGRRTVSIPGALIQMLEAQLRRPEVLRSGLVFPTPLGEPMRRSNFARRVWAPAVEEAGLEGLRFHDLRHTAVALAIGQGAHPKALQDRMGHGSVTVTLDRYGHLYEGLDGQIADGLDRVLRDSRGLTAAWDPSEERDSTSSEGESAGQGGGASKNRTCDLILIRDAL